MTFDEWWTNVGSRIVPDHDEDREEHAKRVARQAVAAQIEQAHMVGQYNEGDGVDPSYSAAMRYSNKILERN